MKDINMITEKIIESVGGKENIISAEYFATIVRLKLVDNSMASTFKLEDLEKKEGFTKGFLWLNNFLVLRFSDDTKKIAENTMIKFKKINLNELNLKDFDDFTLFAILAISVRSEMR